MSASSLGMFFVVVVALGGLGGVWLDNHFHKSPLFAILGVFLGLAAGIREMLKTLKHQSPVKRNAGSPPAAGAPKSPRNGAAKDGVRDSVRDRVRENAGANVEANADGNGEIEPDEIHAGEDDD